MVCKLILNIANLSYGYSIEMEWFNVNIVMFIWQLDVWDMSIFSNEKNQCGQLFMNELKYSVMN